MKGTNNNLERELSRMQKARLIRLVIMVIAVVIGISGLISFAVKYL